ncbi:hypothetical protein [Dactylosporangium darangshiense]
MTVQELVCVADARPPKRGRHDMTVREVVCAECVRPSERGERA